MKTPSGRSTRRTSRSAPGRSFTQCRLPELRTASKLASSNGSGRSSSATTAVVAKPAAGARDAHAATASGAASHCASVAIPPATSPSTASASSAARRWPAPQPRSSAVFFLARRDVAQAPDDARRRRLAQVRDARRVLGGGARAVAQLELAVEDGRLARSRPRQLQPAAAAHGSHGSKQRRRP